jgi:hypothetical protein
MSKVDPAGDGLSEELKFKLNWAAQLQAKERDWISSRTGWNLTAQGLMMTALGLSSKNSEIKILENLTNLIPILGIVISGLTAISVLAALQIQWKSQQKWEGWDVPEDLPSPFIGSLNIIGALSSWLIPVFICVFWIVFLFRIHA